MTEIEIPYSHPRAESLRIREMLIEGFRQGLVAEAGLMAHGRGEAFDYILGEKSHPFAMEAARAAVAVMLLSKHPIISVNGNVAALASRQIVEFSQLVHAPIEVNLFYHSEQREKAISEFLREQGATKVLGVDKKLYATIPELASARRRVDPEGIMRADTVLVPLEDGDRATALVKMGKKVIAIDLNPLSRTANVASITIIDHVSRAFRSMISFAKELASQDNVVLRRIVNSYNNRLILSNAVSEINRRLNELSLDMR